MIIPALLYSWYTKTLVGVLKLLNKGSGTSFPGWLSEKYYPSIVGYFQEKYHKIIYISGTNGKTTTRSILNHLLEESEEETNRENAKQNKTVCSNRGGANIFRGIVSALMLDLTWRGDVKSNYLVLEVEEATLPKLSKFLKPDILVLTNIFRDQLDAYGEIDKTLDFFIQCIKATNPIVIANKDDLKLMQSITPHSTKVYGFSVESDEQIRFEPGDRVPRKEELDRNLRNILTITVETNGKLRIQPTRSVNKLYTAYTHLPGTYNIYNIAAALQTASLLFDTYDYIDKIETYNPAFGRGEIIQINNTDQRIHLFLVKNPAGYDSVLNHIVREFSPDQTQMICALNDNIADGKDVSWIWDVDFEGFFERFKPSAINTVGTRKEDMLLRLQYAEADTSLPQMEMDSKTIIQQFASNSNDNTNHSESSNDPTDLIILATYTALLQIRSIMMSLYPDQLKDMSEKGN